VRLVWFSSPADRPWRFRNRAPTNHPRTSYQTRVLGSRSQRAFFLDGLFASASDVAVLRFLSVYAIALGASNAEVGAIAIANGIAGLAALSPGAWIAERTPSRKWVVLLTGGGVGRVAILLMALLPVLLVEHTAVFALIVLSGLRSFAGSIAHPSWVSLLSDIIPVDLRAFYVSRRMLGIAVIAALGAPLVGFFIRFAGGVDSVSAFQWAFFISFGLGVVSTFFYSRIQEPPRPAGHAVARGRTRAMLSDRGFRRYLAGTFVLHATTMITGPFFAAYLVRELGASATQVGLLGTIDAGSAVVGQFVAGWLAVRYGSTRLLRWSMFLLPLLPALWYLAANPWDTAWPHLIGGAAWAAFNLASFNLVLDSAPEENIPRYAATHQIAVLSASFVGPVIGTAIVAAYGIKAVMIVSAVGRLVALGVMAWPMSDRRAPVSAADIERVSISVEEREAEAEPAVTR
jgi:MFS family permease